MELSIIIASWNVQEHLRRCLKSIFEQPAGLDFEVIVVDNASADQSVQMVLNEFPRAKIFVNQKNVGFAAAINQGSARAEGQYLLILNPDTEVPSGSLAQLLERAKQIPALGVLGGALLNPDGTLQPSVRHFPTLGSQWLIVLKLHHLFGKLKILQNYYATGFDYKTEQEVDQVMGAYFLVQRPVWDELGGFDSKFFVWFEEVDFCFRAKKAGKKVIYTPTGPIIHYGGQSFKQVMGLHRQILFNRSLRHYFKKRQDALAHVILLILQPASIFLAIVAQIFFRPGYTPKPRPLASKQMSEETEKLFKIK